MHKLKHHDSWLTKLKHHHPCRPIHLLHIKFSCGCGRNRSMQKSHALGSTSFPGSAAGLLLAISVSVKTDVIKRLRIPRFIVHVPNPLHVRAPLSDTEKSFRSRIDHVARKSPPPFLPSAFCAHSRPRHLPGKILRRRLALKSS